MSSAIDSQIHVSGTVFFGTESDWTIAKSEAQQGLERLIQALARVGLQTTIRAGENCSILVFVKAADDERFKNEVYKQR